MFKCLDIEVINAYEMRRMREMAVELELNDHTQQADSGLMLIIDSYGGDHDSLVMASRIMRGETAVKFITFAAGACMSAAVPLCASGTKGYRIAHKDATFMVHPMQVRRTYEGPFHGYHEQIRQDYDAAAARQQVYLEMLAGSSDREVSFWEDKVRGNGVIEETYFTAAEAEEWGIVDYIANDYSDAIYYTKHEAC